MCRANGDNAGSPLCHRHDAAQAPTSALQAKHRLKERRLQPTVEPHADGRSVPERFRPPTADAAACSGPRELPGRHSPLRTEQESSSTVGGSIFNAAAVAGAAASVAPLAGAVGDLRAARMAEDAALRGRRSHTNRAPLPPLQRCNFHISPLAVGTDLNSLTVSCVDHMCQLVLSSTLES